MDDVEFEPPCNTSRRTFIRPMSAPDYEFVHTMELSPDVLHRSRLRGSVPGPDQLSRSLWEGVLANFMIVRKDRNAPVGTATLYQADMRNRVVNLAVTIAPQHGRRGYGHEAATLLLNYAFVTWPFRKVQVEVPEFNFVSFASAVGPVYELEGRLTAHEFHDGRHWDRVMLAIDRSRWDAIADRALQIIDASLSVPVARPAPAPRIVVR